MAKITGGGTRGRNPGGKTSRPKNENGAERASTGTKINTNLVPYEATAMMAMGLNYAVLDGKYEARNFEKGLSYTQLLESVKRHTAAIEAGEDTDEDSKIPHIALLASSVAMFCHNYVQGVIIDDRPIAREGKSIAEVATMIQTLETAAVELRAKTKELKNG